MPFRRPSLPTLLDRAAADIEARLPRADARLRRTLLGVLSSVQAGGIHGLYGYLDWMSKQIMPDTAEVEQLDRWASIWDITRKPAASAKGSITFTGTTGTLIPASTAIQRADATEFTTDVNATITAGIALVPITASVVGINSDTTANTKLSLISPVAGINSSATVDANAITSGTALETDDSLRIRLLERIKEPPHGGNQNDFLGWALAVPGVSRAWIYPLELGLGTVSVRFMMDTAYPDGIPQANDVAVVQAAIEVARPVQASVTVVAPVADALNFTIKLTPNDAATQVAVQSELTDLLRRESIPAGILLISHIREAISIAAGETDNVLITPVSDVTNAVGHIAVMGAITWQ